MTDQASLKKGVLAILAVTILFSSMEATAKVLSETFDPFFVVWARYVGQVVATVLIFLPRLATIARTERLGLQILRSALLFFATVMFFSGFARLPLAEVTAIQQLAPLIMTAMAAIVLKERVGPYRWGAVLAGFAGALVILQPGGGAFEWAALFLVAGAFAFAAYGVATRFLGTEDSVWTTFFYTGMVGAVAASLFVPFTWSTPAISDLPLLILIGLLGAAGQAMLVIGMRYAEASLLAPFFYVGILWAAVYGFILFGHVPHDNTIFGALIIVAAGLFVRWRERVRARRDDV